eukprot:g11277.t1
MKRLVQLVLLTAAATGMAVAIAGPRDAQRKLQDNATEFPVSAGEEYVVEFCDESETEVVVMAESENVPEETTVVVEAGSITTILIGTKTYAVSYVYDEDGEVDNVTLVSGDAATRRTQQVDSVDRRLQSCEQSCQANANQLCGALGFGCGYSSLATLLGSMCDDLDALCNLAGILFGCERKCAPACAADDDCTEPNEICCPSMLICEVPDITGACRDPTPGNPAPSTPAPSTPAPSTPAPTTPAPTTPAPTTPAPTTPAPTPPECNLDLMGNVYCDLENNNEQCSYDGGDCCNCYCIRFPIDGYCRFHAPFDCVDPDSPCFQGNGSGEWCSEDYNCPSGEICCPVKNICEFPVDGTNPAACGDPHMTGFMGQKFDFTGEDGGYYAVIADDNMHINMRVTAPLIDLPEITYITGLSVLTTDDDGFHHSIVVEVKDPHDLDSSCPPGGVSPCLADGSLSVVLDGKETLLAPGTVFLGPDVQISAANLPGACRSFGFEKYWERKKLESARHGRRLGEQVSMSEWILGDPTATNLDECAEYVTKVGERGVFAHQSEHASFQIVTPKATIRLSHGRLHQIAMRDPTDQYDLPDHLTWQMNMAVDHNEMSRDAKGILGETLVPTRDADGKPIMVGAKAIRGQEEDYRVGGALETDFAQGVLYTL